MFLFALKDSLEYFGERRTDKSQSSKFQGVETPSQVTTSHQKLFVVKTSNHYDEQLHVAETQKHGSNTTAFFTCEATGFFLQNLQHRHRKLPGFGQTFSRKVFGNSQMVLSYKSFVGDFGRTCETSLFTTIIKTNSKGMSFGISILEF